VLRSRLVQLGSMLALCLLLGTGALYDGEAQSARQRLNQILQRQKQVQGELRELKQEEAVATSALGKAQNELQQARDRAAAAKRRLAEVRAVLRQVKQDLKQTEAELAEHREAMSERLLALYEAGQPSYLEVILNATSFEDFTNRAEFSRLVARQDQELLSALVETEEKLCEQRMTLEVKQAEAAELKQEADRQEAIVEARTREARRLVESIKGDRAAREAEFAALEKAEREIEAIVRAQGSGTSGGYGGTCAGNLLRPCAGRITSPFGWRIHPVWGGRRFHNGVDIGAGYGTTIKAADDGKVIYAGWRGAYGKTVIIDHGSGWATMYGHCSSIYVSRGQVVSRGQGIAAVGSTGVSTGPHLHWTVYRNGRPINPLR